MLLVYSNNMSMGIFVSYPPSVLAMDTMNVRGPVFMDGEFVFILFIMVIVLWIDETLRHFVYFIKVFLKFGSLYTNGMKLKFPHF